MNRKNIALCAALAVASVALPAPAVRAQSALQDLAAQAGADAAPLAASLGSARRAAAASAWIGAAPSVDALASCPAFSAGAVVAANAPQAALLVQTCLNHSYPEDADYSVRATAARFALRACRPVGVVACGAMYEVEGIELVVSGNAATAAPALSGLRAALSARGGLLLGYHAIVVDETR